MFNVRVKFSFDDLLKVVDQLTDEQRQTLQNRLNATQASSGIIQHPKKRVAGLGEGTIWMSDDFNDPLSANSMSG